MPRVVTGTGQVLSRLRRALCAVRGHYCPDGDPRRPVESSSRGQWYIATCRTCHESVEVFVRRGRQA